LITRRWAGGNLIGQEDTLSDISVPTNTNSGLTPGDYPYFITVKDAMRKRSSITVFVELLA
jgi:hypothetical protein